jgi:hypothetical protein
MRIEIKVDSVSDTKSADVIAIITITMRRATPR